MFAFFYICLKFDKKLQNDLWWNCCLKLAIGIGTMWHVPILSYLLYLLNSIKWKHWTEFLKIMTENHCVEGLPNARFLINIWDQTRLIWLSFVILLNFLPTIFTWSTIRGRSFKTLAEIERERKDRQLYLGDCYATRWNKSTSVLKYCRLFDSSNLLSASGFFYVRLQPQTYFYH